MTPSNTNFESISYNPFAPPPPKSVIILFLIPHIISFIFSPRWIQYFSSPKGNFCSIKSPQIIPLLSRSALTKMKGRRCLTKTPQKFPSLPISGRAKEKPQIKNIFAQIKTLNPLLNVKKIVLKNLGVIPNLRCKQTRTRNSAAAPFVAPILLTSLHRLIKIVKSNRVIRAKEGVNLVQLTRKEGGCCWSDPTINHRWEESIVDGPGCTIPAVKGNPANRRLKRLESWWRRTTIHLTQSKVVDCSDHQAWRIQLFKDGKDSLLLYARKT